MATPPQPTGQHQGAGPYNPYAAPVPQQGGPAGPGYAGQQPYGTYGAYGTHPAPGRYGCRLCGAWPAAHATVRGHQGLIVLMRFLSLRGPFCRDCGLATYRRMSSDTLWQGWWGPLSVFITPVTLLMNLGPRAAFRKLAPPAGGHRPALDPGKPMWRRGPVLLFLAPVLLVVLAVPALVVAAAVFGDPRLSVGQCVRNEGNWVEQELEVESCTSSRARFRVTERLDAPGAHCAPGDYISDPKYSRNDFTTFCLTPLG
ncbi:LppU/SCO3897 family protein [Streptomyces xanthophaeus]|uniref:LppU/SCO3897 family protein n=1 Tax=Streptomyces xanthophaeus TaxID=67385 RepID=UPI0026482D5C|nr:hypothetical protein [Streptomyces xanthophaeus]WKD35853.1 hypothetical protein KO717_30540 [Streptomyces xanthophaeus]